MHYCGAWQEIVLLVMCALLLWATPAAALVSADVVTAALAVAGSHR